MNNQQRNAREKQSLRDQKPEVWLGIVGEIGGYGRYVVADSKESAETVLLKAWRDYDKSNGSDYHGRIKSFEDLSEIYGAQVQCMPWNQYLHGMAAFG
jgi:hypothetical protein